MLAHRVPYPANKGEKIRTFNHLAYLVGKGHHVTVLAPLENSEDKKFAEQLSERLAVKVVHARLDNRQLRIVRGLTSRQALSVTNFHSAELQNKFKTLITAEQPDVIMCTSSAMAKYVFHPPASALIKKQNIRLVMDFMDLDSLKWGQYAEHKPWPQCLIYKREAKLLASLENKILKKFDTSVFVSVQEKELLNNGAELNSKVQVVSNGVDISSYYPDEHTIEENIFGDASPVVLFTGVMDYFPNEDAVVWFADTAWPAIIQQHPKAKFIIAGMRPSRKVAELENRRGIKVTGYLDEILPYYQQADFLVAPFRVARGIQNKVMQAMACGLPVLASPEGASGINYVDNEHLVIAETPQDYLNAINTLINDQAAYKRISQASLQLITKQYSWEDENAKLELLLKCGPASDHSTAASHINRLSTV